MVKSNFDFSHQLRVNMEFKYSLCCIALFGQCSVDGKCNQTINGKWDLQVKRWHSIHMPHLPLPHQTAQKKRGFL